MRRALVIQPDGSQRTIEVPDFPNDVPVLQKELHGHMEAVRMPNGLWMLVNDEGKLKGMPVNVRATELSGLFPHDVIAGPAVIMGGVDPYGDNYGLTDEDLAALS